MRCVKCILVIAQAAVLFMVLSTPLLGSEPERADAPTYTEVAELGLVAHLYVPPGAGPFTAVLAVSGSEGGIATGDAFAKLLVREGFVVLALAHFGMSGLPEQLDRIPLEYFIRAIDYLQRQRSVDSQRIGIVGGSKGGELALLLATMEPRIHGVCALVPSSVVWQSARAADSPTSSWTLHGQQLPFVPYKGPLMPASGRLADLFDLSLTQTRAAAIATIPVEKINGPVLLISADQDEIWPSRLMSEAMLTRLRERGFAFPYEHRHYDTPHMFSKETAPPIERAVIEFFLRL